MLFFITIKLKLLFFNNDVMDELSMRNINIIKSAEIYGAEETVYTGSVTEPKDFIRYTIGIDNIAYTKINKLSNLYSLLYRLGLKKEADEIKKLSSTNDVFMHISGPSGSGKTTLMEKIQEIYPQSSCKDLDEFDEEATESLNLKTGWKRNNYTDELAIAHYKEKQRLLENFISENKDKKIILVGIHSEGDFSLKFKAQYKIILNTSIIESLKRRIKRDKKLNNEWKFWNDKDLIKSELNESKKIVSELKSQNYVLMSEDEILNLLEDKLSNS